MNTPIITSYDQVHQLLQFHAAQSTYDATMFFKMEPGSYGAHDQFLGIKNPILRQIAKSCKSLPFDEIIQLLQSPYNEYRMLALFILVDRYQVADSLGRDKVYRLYVDHIDQVNNWNLVDASAHWIVGAHHFDGKIDRSELDDLVVSPSLWRRRIAIVATWYHIRKNSLDLTVYLIPKVLADKHDLMHKAAGWMLRELGKKDEQKLREFLKKYHLKMARTCLRYAIERLPDKALILRSGA